MRWYELLLINFFGAFPLLGFFGTQAVRLLRESWDGVIRAQKDGEIKPFGATNLAYELYSMLDDNIPQTQNAPVTINAPPNGGGLTINGPTGNGPMGVNVFKVNGGNVDIGGNDFPSNISIGRGPTTNRGGDTVSFGGSMISFGPIDVAVCQPVVGIPSPCAAHITVPDGTTVNGTPFPQPSPGTSVFLGKVISGTGNSYQVALYENGPTAGPSSTVTATVPQIDPAEQIPTDTWITAVHAFATKDSRGETVLTYAFQPAVWLQ